MMRAALPFALSVALVASACSAALRSSAPAPLSPEQMEELWIEPVDITTRNLFWGPGSPTSAPAPNALYRLEELDDAGFSPGYEVVGPDGRKWKLKLGLEAQSEIAASRLLWAIGFHQPEMYLVRDWTVAGARPDDQGAAARFRSKARYKTGSNWSWNTNPFVGTREFKGLLVAQLILNNWDVKGTNNRIYKRTDAGPGPRTWFVVQDLGASLGATHWPTGNRNNIDAFESQNLIERVAPGRIEFDYHARHRELFADLSPADVVWTCRLLSQLTDQQWNDAFRAARYPDSVAARYVAKLRSKVQEGLRLTPQAGN